MQQTILSAGLSIALSVTLAGLPAFAQQSGVESPSPVPKTQAEVQRERDQSMVVPPIEKQEAITQVRQAGLMAGDSDGTFQAERSLTRAELATILVKAFDLDERKTASPQPIVLKDVPSTHWAASDINTVVRLGVMQGYRDNLFYPNQKIDRAEALAIFAQAYGVQQYDDETVKVILSQYPDASTLPDWSRKAMATALKYGFVDVAESGKIRPMQPMTRGDMAYALAQYLQRLHPTEQPAAQ